MNLRTLFRVSSAALPLVLATAACGAEDEVDGTAAPAEPSTAAQVDSTPPLTGIVSTTTDVPDEGPLPLPIPINAVMVSLVDFAADGVWRPAASEQPLDDRDWLLAEQDAINLIAAATLITTPGSGASDAEWVNNDDWRRYTLDMRESAIQALDAVHDRDQERLRIVGDALVETCQDCHQEFKPGLPQMGVTRFPYYPKRAED